MCSLGVKKKTRNKESILSRKHANFPAATITCNLKYIRSDRPASLLHYGLEQKNVSELPKTQERVMQEKLR